MSAAARPPANLAAVRRFKAAKANLDAATVPSAAEYTAIIEHLCDRHNQLFDALTALRAEVAALRSIPVRQDALEQAWAGLQAVLDAQRRDAPIEVGR